ncbi:MAG: hypothetical protein LCI00_07105 [Chloroflexi bacterium]|nr:hypothetical protein [Chloroflexota bacterium]MCC6891638.1 hypothetical protein [Anaerolineae bacterium]
MTAHTSLETLAQQFATPQKEFSPVPIWWWSGDKLERGRLRWQMEQLIAGGIYNVIILNLAPTSPLYGSDPDRPHFMTEEWWTIFLEMCEDAKALGMRVWFYDQIGFSGANLQGGIVRDNPDYAGQALNSVTVEGTGSLRLECPSEGTPIAASYVLLDAHGQVVGKPVALKLDGRSASVDVSDNKRLRLMYAIRRGFDYFNADGCARLMDVIHHEFERRAGQYFGSVIVGSFQDELPSMLTWSSVFTEAFQQIKGYDLRDHMTALWEGEGAEAERVRVDYHQVRADLAEKAIFKPLFDWHRKHGLVCGVDQQSPARTGEPIGGVQQYADYMQTHRWYDVPGSDHHGNAKIHSSLAHLYDRPRVWIESFHSSGWGGTLEETFDWLLPWLRNGATLYDPHAVYYSTWGGWYEWAPPSTCWRQPYWRHYSAFANTVSRLCFLLSQGTHVCDVGVLYPTTTIQSGLTVDGVLSASRTANDTFIALTGTMMFLQMVAGTLEQDKRDFDVLDDDSVQRGTAESGQLRIGAERYKAIVLPDCKVLEGTTADQLVRFVAQGGLLVAVGALPDHVVNGTDAQLKALLDVFASGKAVQIQSAAEIAAVLRSLPRVVEAPVPVLHRQIDGADVLYIPAASPHATRNTDTHNDGLSWLRANYEFNPARYQNPMTITVRGFNGTPYLWDAFSGERRAVKATVNGDTTEIELSFDSSPAALLVWEKTDNAAQVIPPQPETSVIPLGDVWTATLEQTLDNRYGDLTKPDFAGAPPVQTWSFAHHLEQAGDDGVSGRWYEGAVEGESVMATFGSYGWWSGVKLAKELPKPLEAVPLDGQLGGEGWCVAEYSLQRGIYKDALHVPNLGPKAHVPEEFLTFGHVNAGEGVQFRTTIWSESDRSCYLALAAPTRKRAWLNGELIGEGTPGYLWMTPITLKQGANLLEWRLVAETETDLRAYWAFVTDAAAFARPERMIPADKAQRDSRIEYVYAFEVDFEPTSMIVQVSADSPCKLIVNGVEAGRQGGFDPYASLARVQPYVVQNCRKGTNEIIVEIQDTGSTPIIQIDENDEVIEREVPLSTQGLNQQRGYAATMVDALIEGAGSERLSITSGAHWQVRRDGGAAQPVKLFRIQWNDPAWPTLWRRPHPLPEAAWLDNTPSNGVVLPVVPDAQAGQARVEWFAWQLPPGVREVQIPVAGQARLWVDGEECALDNGAAHIGLSDKVQRVAWLRVEPENGRTGGGVFTAPITYTTAAGAMRLGDWAAQGLTAYSGGIRYQTTFRLDALSSGVVLDLGKVRGTAEVTVNGQGAGVRVWSPYQFDITALCDVGENTVEVLVLNTLAPYLDAVSPTHYVRPGQKVSGLFGPVQVRVSQ